MEIPELYRKYLISKKVSTDTRQIIPGSIFFALKGDKFNANAFAGEALDKGATFAVIDEENQRKDDRFILVDNVLESLQRLARYHRDQFHIPFLALTGSNGKTTSKELLHAVLSRKFRTLATKGNLNNHIGVPLTILSVDESTEIAVIEMGANHVNEIALLCTIADPTHGFITNIGRAHIGTFGGFDQIVSAKSELFHHLISRNGQVFINSLHPALVKMSTLFDHPLFYPRAEDYYHAELITADPFVRVRAENGDEIKTQLVGAYNFENIAAALCIGKYFEVDAAMAHEAIRGYVPGNMRSQVIEKGTNTIIMDAYNANPSSMMAAIENLAAMKASKKVLVLGDMFELEKEADREHKEIGRLIRVKGFEHVYLCGSLFKAALREIPAAKYFEKKDQLAAELKQFPIRNATILVKASRGIRLETILDYL